MQLHVSIYQMIPPSPLSCARVQTAPVADWLEQLCCVVMCANTFSSSRLWGDMRWIWQKAYRIRMADPTFKLNTLKSLDRQTDQMSVFSFQIMSDYACNPLTEMISRNASKCSSFNSLVFVLFPVTAWCWRRECTLGAVRQFLDRNVLDAFAWKESWHRTSRTSCFHESQSMRLVQNWFSAIHDSWRCRILPSYSQRGFFLKMVHPGCILLGLRISVERY